MNKRFPSFTIIILAVALSIMGIALVPLLPVKLSSSRVLPQITVSYNLRNASGVVLESEVTSKLEAVLARIQGVKNISSVSSSGSGYISLEFDKSVDMDIARFEVSTAVRQVWPQLPEGLSYPSVSARSAETSGSDRTPFIVYTINAPELPYKIQQYAEENLQPELARIEGISQVDISGATPMEWILEYDLEQLRALGITTSDITMAVNEYVQTNYLGMAHTIDLSGNVVLMRLAILPQGEFDVDNLSQIPVKKVDGTIITLDKLVRASHQQQKPSSYYRINGLNTVSMRLFAEKSANQLELSRQVRETMDRLTEAMPPGFEVSLSNDTTEYIRAELDKLSAALRASCSTLPNGKTLNISISGGVAWYPEDGKDLKTLKKYADFAMYQVKQSRKGQVGDFDIGVYHREEYAAQTQREFLQLLREEQVYYYFQPIFSAQTGRVVAYEALMRVNTPTITSPSQVMALAHELDRLYDIERITMFHSSEAFEKLQSRGLIRKDALLFVNSIANVDLNDEDIQKYHRRYPDLLKQLVVEITEQEDLDRACLERKRNIPGFSGAFALDDYGTGYSNELNLLELSPQYIKIDISIIRGIEKDLDKQQIVSNIVAYAHARSMQILAEGIEEEIQLRKVIDLGVDLLQGYYLSRPAAVPSPIASEALDVIRAANAAHSDVG